jgi:hypothetical protein
MPECTLVTTHTPVNVLSNWMVRRPFDRSQLGAIAHLMSVRSSSSGTTFLRKHDRNRHNAGADLLTCDAWWIHSSRSGRMFLGELVPYSALYQRRCLQGTPSCVAAGLVSVPASREVFSIQSIAQTLRMLSRGEW